MSGLSEITQLFGGLASRLRRRDESHDPFPVSHESLVSSTAVASLGRSLNPSTSPGLRVMETALSLMCFSEPQVSRTTVGYLVETIVVALSSLQVGSSIVASADCFRLIDDCVDILPSLQGYDDLSQKLLRAVLVLAASTCFQDGIPLSSMLSKLYAFLPEEISGVICETPLRSLLWDLDPLAFKHDISEVLRGVVERPFLCLKEELHTRLAWRAIVVCLLLSPTFFVEARALLHSWFLVTGLSFVQDLRIAFVSSMLDALSRPMWWGLSKEMGLRLPRSRAYFPSTSDELLTKLTGPISCQNFLELVQLVMRQISENNFHARPAGSCASYSNPGQIAVELVVRHHNCTWAMLMDFQYWFYYAAMLLFSRGDFQENALLKGASLSVKADEGLDLQIIHGAARYLAWILWPVNDIKTNMMVDCMTEISGSWLPKHGTDNSTHLPQSTKNDKVGRNLKLRKPRVSGVCTKKSQFDVEIRTWLEHFDGLFVKYYHNMAMDHEVITACSSLMHPDLLFRRIPLGIVIGCSKYLDEKGCELLLHYAATSEIIGSEATAKHKTRGCDGEDFDNRFGMKEIVDGISLLFNLFDVIEDISVLVLDDERNAHDYICCIKSKACSYLLTCIKKLLKHEFEGHRERVGMLTDLTKRLERWRCQGGEIFGGYESVDEVAKELTAQISVYEQT